jgi:hypothetical protein
MAVGLGLMIMLDERSSMYLNHLHLKLDTNVFPSALQIIYPLIAGLGLGGLFLPPLIGLQAAMPVKDMATSSTTFGLFRLVSLLPASLKA